MPYQSRNVAACALSSDTIYVFGGRISVKDKKQLSNVILLYLIAANLWIELPVKLPQKVALLTPVKINSSQIALFGGLSYNGDLEPENEDESSHVQPTCNVLVFDSRLPAVTFARDQLIKPFVSLVSPFYNARDNVVLLVNEQSPSLANGLDVKKALPELLCYSLTGLFNQTS